jgi:hypothetical protein
MIDCAVQLLDGEAVFAHRIDRISPELVVDIRLFQLRHGINKKLGFSIAQVFLLFLLLLHQAGLVRL